MSKGDDYTLKHWASQMWTGMYAHACTLRVAECLSVCVLGSLIPFLRRISSPHQLSSPILGIGVAHFRVITLDLLNHCFFWSLSSNDAKTRTKEEEKKKGSHFRAEGRNYSEARSPLSALTMCFSALSFPLFGSLQPAGKNVSVLSVIAAPNQIKSQLSSSRWSNGIMDGPVWKQTDSRREDEMGVMDSRAAERGANNKHNVLNSTTKLQTCTCLWSLLMLTRSKEKMWSSAPTSSRPRSSSNRKVS